MSQGPTQINVVNWGLHRPIANPPRKKWDWVKPGDWFAFFAKPTARFLDKYFKTHYVGCGPCGQRQIEMNRWPARAIKFLLTFYV